MSARRLLLDAGNTRLKWAVVEAGRWVAHGSTGYDDLSGLEPALTRGVACHVASVARKTHEAMLEARLSTYAIEPRWLASTASFGDVQNGYADPGQLGVDRWMALLAARERTRAAVLVVSVGTAMTVDALSAEGRFLGGVITPGVALMRAALAGGTARLAPCAAASGPAAPPQEGPAFPQTTAAAIDGGIVAALCGAIRGQYAQLARAARMQPHCLVTGGDADWLMPRLEFPVEPAPGLVLEGIERVTRESKYT